MKEESADFLNNNYNNNGNDDDDDNNNIMVCLGNGKHYLNMRRRKIYRLIWNLVIIILNKVIFQVFLQSKSLECQIIYSSFKEENHYLSGQNELRE